MDSSPPPLLKVKVPLRVLFETEELFELLAGLVSEDTVIIIANGKAKLDVALAVL